MDKKSIMEAEIRKIDEEIEQLRTKRVELRTQVKEIEVAEAELSFPIGTIITRHAWHGKLLRIVYKGFRIGTYGIEEYGKNIRKDGTEGRDVMIYGGYTKDWKPENA